jgi:hypothetical protein
MKEPYYFADEKELFAKIFEMSDELTRSFDLVRSGGEAPSKKRKPKRDTAARNSDAGEGKTLPVPN